jgi:membrane protease YdiL (CAAX protease family)
MKKNVNYLPGLKKDTLDLLRFIKKPNDLQFNCSVKEKISLIFNLLTLEIIFSLLFVFPFYYIAEQFIAVEESEVFKNLTLFNTVLLVVIMAPLAEELIFRYSLRYNKLFSKFITRKKWNRIFPFLVYILSVLFGFIHLDNYVNDSWKFYALSPLIIASQLSGGLILSYIRVRLSILYSMLYHAIWNLLVGIIIPSAYLFFTPAFVENTSDYHIKIEEKAFVNTVTFNADIKDDKVYYIEARQYQFQALIDYIYGKEKFRTDEGLIDIDFESEKGISKEEFLKILQKKYDVR